MEVTVVGNNREHSLMGGGKISAPDIKAGMALLIAALSAEKGESEIHNAQQIHRGYENIVQRLRMIGDDIKEEK